MCYCPSLIFSADVVPAVSENISYPSAAKVVVEAKRAQATKEKEKDCKEQERKEKERKQQKETEHKQHKIAERECSFFSFR